MKCGTTSNCFNTKLFQLVLIFINCMLTVACRFAAERSAFSSHFESWRNRGSASTPTKMVVKTKLFRACGETKVEFCAFHWTIEPSHYRHNNCHNYCNGRAPCSSSTKSSRLLQSKHSKLLIANCDLVRCVLNFNHCAFLSFRRTQARNQVMGKLL